MMKIFLVMEGNNRIDSRET